MATWGYNPPSAGGQSRIDPRTGLPAPLSNPPSWGYNPPSAGGQGRIDPRTGLPSTEHKIPVPPGGNFTGSPPPVSTPGAPVPAFDYTQWAASLFIGWPPELISLLGAYWTQTGNLDVALGMLRQNREVYDRYFPGIRRTDGTLRMTETEYFQTKDAYRQLLGDYGLNAGLFESNGSFVRAIEGDVSVQELSDRLAMTYQGVAQQKEAIRAYYAETAGVAMTDEAILAAAIDPTINRALLEQRISAAQVGGEARSFGFDRRSRVDTLLRAGVDQDQARQFYSAAGERVATLSTLAQRYYDADDTFGIDDLEDAALLLDADEQERARRLINSERAYFTDVGGVRVEAGAVTGLRQR